MATFTVSGLFVYPIKSCKGVALTQVHHSLRGFVHDREWAVIDEPTRKVLTQREVPRLCLIRTAIQGGELAFGAAGGGDMRIPIGIEDDPDVRRLDVEVWGAKVPAVDEGMWPAGWFSSFLRRRCRLVRFDRAHVRRSQALDSSSMAFADAHELLVISEASLADLNARLETPLQMDRFRPNIVVSGCPAYAEDDWPALSVASVRMSGADPCVRCVVTTTDQATGERGKEPLRTLAGYRKTTKGVIFGRNFNAHNGGFIRLGDPVSPLTNPFA